MPDSLPDRSHERAERVAATAGAADAVPAPLRVLIATAPATPMRDGSAAAADAWGRRLLGTNVVGQVEPAPARRMPFRKVTAPLADPRHEHGIAQLLRSAHFDVLHLDGFAHGISVHLPWLAHALGVACTVAITGALACHRGDLCFADGSPCHTTDDAERCAACCRRASPGRAGLSRTGARLAAATRWLGALTPFPHPLAFSNRSDLIAAGLAEADAVIVGDAGLRASAAQFGVPSAKVHVLAGTDVTALVRLWRGLVRTPVSARVASRRT